MRVEQLWAGQVLHFQIHYERKNVSGGDIMLNPVFDQFVKKSPISVMARGMMERVLDPQQLDNWFETTADRHIPRSFYSQRCLKS